MSPVIFISHGAPESAPHGRAYHVRKLLYQNLKDAGWDPFMDDECLPPGERWRPGILHALATCQAGVILFDARTKTRPWVANEALILLFRKYFHQSLPLRFVTIADAAEDLSPEQQEVSRLFRQIYEPLQLAEYQQIVDPPTDAAWTVEELVKSIVQSLQESRPAAAQCHKANDWVSGMRQILAGLNHIAVEDLEAALIDVTAAGMHDAPDEGVPLDTNQRRLAIAKALYACPITETATLLDAIQPSVAETPVGRQLAARLYPLWANANAVSHIWPVTTGRRNQYDLMAIHMPDDASETNQFDMARLQVLRAQFDLPRKDSLLFVPCLGRQDFRGSRRQDQAVWQIARQLNDAYSLGEENVANIRNKVRARSEAGDHAVCLLSHDWCDAGLLQAVRAAFPRTGLLLYTSQPQPAFEEKLAPLRIKFLSPGPTSDEAFALTKRRTQLKSLDCSEQFWKPSLEGKIA